MSDFKRVRSLAELTKKFLENEFVELENDQLKQLNNEDYLIYRLCQTELTEEEIKNGTNEFMDEFELQMLLLNIKINKYFKNATQYENDELIRRGILTKYKKY